MSHEEVNGGRQLMSGASRPSGGDLCLSDFYCVRRGGNSHLERSNWGIAAVHNIYRASGPKPVHLQCCKSSIWVKGRNGGEKKRMAEIRGGSVAARRSPINSEVTRFTLVLLS